MPGINNEDAKLGMLLVTFAGMSTCIGASVVFSKRFVKLASTKFLAGSLGISAGVMLYVSFVEILVKSRLAFISAGEKEGMANLYSTLCFFLGILIMYILNLIVHRLEEYDGNDIHCEHGHMNKIDFENMVYEIEEELDNEEKVKHGEKIIEEDNDNDNDNDDDIELQINNNNDDDNADEKTDVDNIDLSSSSKTNLSPSISKAKDINSSNNKNKNNNNNKINNKKAVIMDKHKERKLIRMGLMTALAMGIHNFPEGLATFIATLNDPTVGLSLAIAIAIHNIPEGLCVAIPVYYVTHNRWKAFWWAFVTGISEPIGAGLGWLILYSIMSDFVYGFVFGIVGGMMVYMCIKELIPTAHTYDPKDEVTSHFIVLGMFVMSISLVMFTL